MDKELDELMKSEVGSRKLGSAASRFVCFVSITWSLFQIWISSPLQYYVASQWGCEWLLFDDLQSRRIHLAFSMILTFILFPVADFAKCRERIPWYDVALALLGVFAALYLVAFDEELESTLGKADGSSVLISLIGICVLLEASRRSIGSALTIVGMLFIAFAYFGPYMGEILSHKSLSLATISTYHWISSEGVFGIALGVSSSFVFLYVLFGALLEKAGAGDFFIQLSFALLKRFVGGPAKAAVVASGLMGMISGSSMANTITVGSLTIPLMKRMGLSSAKAAAIEVSAGINGQIMPPVMGASAFIMADYLSIPYTEVVKHAFLPAILVYIALLYIVHLEALKLGFSTKGIRPEKGAFYSILRFSLIATMLIICFGVVYFVIEGIQSLGFLGVKGLLGDYYGVVISIALILLYIAIIWMQSGLEDEGDQDYSSEDYKADVPALIKRGLHYFIPLVILVWCLLVERYSPTLAAYWTIAFLALMLLTQKPLAAFFSRTGEIKAGFHSGSKDLLDALIGGAKNMTAIAIATATAGIIVGSVALTGLGLKISGLVDYIAGGNVFATLILTAIVCIVLGMGMPTTACYVIVATVMVPVLDYLLNKNGIATPKFALHLFVFYFGLMADVTPPVGLASYAAAAIARANPIETGIQAFLYNMRTMALPFIFIFNPTILLYNVPSLYVMLFTLVTSVSGILVVAAATQGYFMVRSRILESCALAVVGFSLLFPQAWSSMLFPDTYAVNLSAVEETQILPHRSLKLLLKSPADLLASDGAVGKVVVLYPSRESSVAEVMKDAGIEYEHYEDSILVEKVHYKSQAYEQEVGDKSRIVKIEIYDGNTHVLSVVLVAFGVLAAIYVLQMRRKKC